MTEFASYSTTHVVTFRRIMLYVDGNQTLVRLAIVGRGRNVSGRLKKNCYVKAIMVKARTDNHYMVKKLEREEE